jgi:antitoxin HigA-1
MAREIPLPHPGEVLKEEFFEPLGISVYAAAKAIGVSRGQLNEICKGKHRITAPIALRLGRYLNVDPRWFMNMQTKYDLEHSAADLAQDLQAIEPFADAA